MIGFIRLWVIALALISCQEDTKSSVCSCNTELESVIDYYEENLPAYRVDVLDKNNEHYTSFKDNLLKKANNVADTLSCFKVVNSYVQFFQDAHSKLTMISNAINDSDKKAVEAFQNSQRFKNREFIPVEKGFYKQFPLDDIRGVYTHKSKAYKIAILPDSSESRDYIGVVLESKTPLWKPGQVKLEIKLNNAGNTAYLYMKNHSIRYYNRFPYNNGVLGDGWFKDNLKEKIDYSSNTDRQFFTEKLNDSITYMRFPSFSNNYNAKIDSLYKASEEDIKSSDYLIMDLRNNGGGNDENAFPLIKYIYTKPIKTDIIDHYVTKDNLKKWEEAYKDAQKDTINFKKEDLKWFSDIISQMRSTPFNSFFRRNDGQLIELEESEIDPKNVAIIYNRGTASSAETPLLWAMQSENAILVGENSAGYTGYGEVFNTKTECFNFNISSTMTKYKEALKYDGIGIEPDVQLEYDSDWVEQTIDLLESQHKNKIKADNISLPFSSDMVNETRLRALPAMDSISYLPLDTNFDFNFKGNDVLKYLDFYNHKLPNNGIYEVYYTRLNCKDRDSEFYSDFCNRKSITKCGFLIFYNSETKNAKVINVDNRFYIDAVTHLSFKIDKDYKITLKETEMTDVDIGMDEPMISDISIRDEFYLELKNGSLKIEKKDMYKIIVENF